MRDRTEFVLFFFSLSFLLFRFNFRTKQRAFVAWLNSSLVAWSPLSTSCFVEVVFLGANYLAHTHTYMAASSSSFAASGVGGATAGRLKNDDYATGGGGKYRLDNDDYRIARSSNASSGDFRGAEPDFRGTQAAYSAAAAADYRLREEFRSPDLGPGREPDFGSRTGGGGGSGISAAYNPHIWNYGVTTKRLESSIFYALIL